MKITEMNQDDFKLFWPVFKDIVAAQETYAYNHNKFGSVDSFIMFKPLIT